MIQIFGWIGLIGLVIAFALLITKWSKYFLITDGIATLFLFIHALLLKDIPFIFANLFIAISLLYKQYKGGIK